ncbi:hypothetical protein BKH43_02655 [Helicobacter sp. 13S00401-1]|uniref:hypothetical protein n=1 Tax=Helicobacter sp. 13S00401-1 TaxID=1905758 RepID=UPI000BA7B49B|nr:hypothetical protein [Helicobacter sp. 13S00401-1]PAF51124.1 hypothetical protein BKH43_02655 [Helicobacter sp. 13S00401-1]
MYRKLLSLAYVYEIKGDANKSRLIYEKILELKDLGEDIPPLELLEARLGKKALKYMESKDMISGLDVSKLKEKIKGVKTQDESVIRWLYRWN